MNIRQQWGTVKKLYNLEHPNYGQTCLKNINLPTPRTFLKKS